MVSPKVDLTVPQKEEEFGKLFMLPTERTKDEMKEPSSEYKNTCKLLCRCDNLDNRAALKDCRVFASQEIVLACTKIKTGKAPGPDGILPEVLKYIMERKIELFKNIYNKYRTRGHFPDAWK